jgi:hypothetical protein
MGLCVPGEGLGCYSWPAMGQAKESCLRDSRVAGYHEGDVCAALVVSAQEGPTGRPVLSFAYLTGQANTLLFIDSILPVCSLVTHWSLNLQIFR